MKDKNKTKSQLIAELAEMRRYVEELERSASRGMEQGERIEESILRYKELANMLPQTVFECDTEGSITFVNERAFDSFGYTREDLKRGLNIFQMVSPEDRDKVWQCVRRGLAGEEIREVEFTVVKKDDHVFPVLVYARPIMHENIPVGIRGFVVDITERKQAEEELAQIRIRLEDLVAERTFQLRESEEKYRNLVENALVGVYQTNLKGDVLYANRTALRILGFDSLDEAKKLGSSSLYLRPMDRAAILKALKQIGSVSGFETEFITGGGETITVLLSAAPHQGVITGMLMDITGRKRGEERLIESEERYRTAIEFSNDGVAIVQKGKHVYVNHKFLEIFGYNRPEEVVGKTHGATVHPDDLKNVMEYNRKREAGDIGPARYEFKGIRKGGTPIYLEVSAAGITFLGKPATLSYFRDITERKRTERELGHYREHLVHLVEERTAELRATNEQLKRQIVERLEADKNILLLNQELEKRVAELNVVNEELRVLSFALSHDLRTPLALVGGFSRRLQEKYGELLDGRGRQYLRAINASCLQMERLITDLLIFFSSGNRAIEPSLINMYDLANEVLVQLEAAHRPRTICSTIKRIPDTAGDRSMIQEVLANLLGNAIKYSKTRDMTVIEVGGWEEESRNVFYVKDNGVGFPEDRIDSLFRPLQRLHPSDQFDGTGLGLAIVKHVINRHGGEVWAESHDASGATFYFSIPRLDACNNRPIESNESDVRKNREELSDD